MRRIAEFKNIEVELSKKKPRPPHYQTIMANGEKQCDTNRRGEHCLTQYAFINIENYGEFNLNR
jgi:hypothetical protein